MTDGTIFSDPFAPPGEPAPELLRGGRYWLPPVGDPTGKPVSRQRVTNFVKAVSDTFALDEWKQRRVVVGLSRREDLYDLARGTAADDRGTLKSIVEQSLEAAKVFDEGGADTGTAFHAYTDQVDQGRPHTARAKWAPKLENYRLAMTAHGLSVVPGMLERNVVIERFGVAGKLDRILHSAHTGELYIGDLKSQKSFYTWWEIALQLALYSEADAIWNPDTLAYEEMPAVSRDVALVAWMPVVHPGADRDAVTIYDVDIEQARPALAVVASVLEMRKAGTKWGRPRPLPVAVEPAVPLSEEEAYARRFRDATTIDEVMAIGGEAAGRGVLSDILRAIAATRWEELHEKATRPDPVRVDPHAGYNALPPMVRASQDVRANLREGTGIGVTPGGVRNAGDTARYLVMQDDASAAAAMHDGAAELARARHAIATHYLAGGDTEPRRDFGLSDMVFGSALNRHTPDEWSRRKGIRVVDPWGWRHSPGGPADWATPLTEDEFDRRALTSTTEKVATGPDYVVNGQPAPHITDMAFSGPLRLADPFRPPHDSGPAPDLSRVQADSFSRTVASGWGSDEAYVTPPDLRALAEQGIADGGPVAPEILDALRTSNRHVPVLDAPEVAVPQSDPPLMQVFASGGLADLVEVVPADPSPEAVGTAEDQGVDIAGDLVEHRSMVAVTAGVPGDVVREVVKRARNSGSARGRTRLMNDLSRKYAPDDDDHARMLSDLVHAVWGAPDVPDQDAAPPVSAPATPPDVVTESGEAEAFGQPDGMTELQQATAAHSDAAELRRTTIRDGYAPTYLGRVESVQVLISMGRTARTRAERTAVVTELGRRGAFDEEARRLLIDEHPGFPAEGPNTGPVADLSGARVLDVQTPPPAESGIEPRPIELLSVPKPLTPDAGLVLHPDPAIALEQVRDLVQGADSVAAIQRVWAEAARLGAWSEELETLALQRFRQVD